jgi:hypothetical protein
MGGGGKDSGGGGGTEVINTVPDWMMELGEWSADKFKGAMGKQENYSPYPDMTNPYGEYKSLFGGGTGEDYLKSFSAAPKAAYDQALTDTKNLFGARGTYGSVGNGLMSGAMSSAAGNYATAMADAQQKAQAAQLQDYQASAVAPNWLNENALNKLNYGNTMQQQIISNLLGGMGITVPSIVQGQTVVQDEGGGGKGGLGSAVGGMASLGGALYSSSHKFKENKRPAEDVLENVKTLTVERWKYKDGFGDNGEHIGPYAEDWAERFGGTGVNISAIDEMGVLLKAVQELAAQVDELKKQLEAA